MNSWMLAWFLLVHTIGDFVLQTDWQAKNKSTEIKALCSHVGVYTLTLMIAATFAEFNAWKALLFALLNGIVHFVTDAISSKYTTHFFGKGDHHNGFVIVGFDQLAHILWLMCCISLFENMEIFQ